MIFVTNINTHEIAIPKATAITPGLRVVITSNEAAIADATVTGIGVVQGFDGANVVVRPRVQGMSAILTTDEAVDAYAPLYAKAGGLVGALTAAEPLVCFALESVGEGGGPITCMWAVAEVADILSQVPS
jgi:hypothetical protein